MRRIFLAVACGLTLIGCHPSVNQVTSLPSRPGGTVVLTLEGPSGTVSLGDPPDQAKRAFPAPHGAMVFNRSMNFAILGKDGWSWASQKDMNGFEEASSNGKIIAFAVTGGDVTKEPAASTAKLGPPARKAEGKTCGMYVWDAGDDARILICMTSPASVLPVGTMLLVGKKDDLKLLNYRSDDPDTFVKQMDSTASQMNSPEMKKIFEDAKQQALKNKSAAPSTGH